MSSKYQGKNIKSLSLTLVNIKDLSLNAGNIKSLSQHKYISHA